MLISKKPCNLIVYGLLNSLVVEWKLRVREVPGSIPSQGPRHTKNVIKLVPVVPLFSTEHYTWKYWLFLKNRKIVRRLRSLAVVAGMTKPMTTHNQQKSNANKKKTKIVFP